MLFEWFFLILFIIIAIPHLGLLVIYIYKSIRTNDKEQKRLNKIIDDFTFLN